MCTMLHCCIHAEYIEATRKVQPQLGNVTVPWICFHGEGEACLCMTTFFRMQISQTQVGINAEYRRS